MGIVRFLLLKRWLFLVIPLLLIPAIILIFKSSQQPKITIIDKQISEIRQEQHPSLYFVDLEYDPATEKIIKKASVFSNGDMASLKDQPSISPETFSFGVEVISPSKKTLLSGWESLYKTVIETKEGKYFFRVSIPYTKGEILRIYSIGYEKLWEEEVK